MCVQVSQLNEHQNEIISPITNNVSYSSEGENIYKEQ